MSFVDVLLLRQQRLGNWKTAFRWLLLNSRMGCFNFKLFKNGVVKADKFSKANKPQQGWEGWKLTQEKQIFILKIAKTEGTYWAPNKRHQFWELCSLVFNYSTCLMKVTSTGWHKKMTWQKNMDGLKFSRSFQNIEKNLPPSQDVSRCQCRFHVILTSKKNM